MSLNIPDIISQIQTRIAEIDAEVAALRTQRDEINVKIKALGEEREEAAAMLPRKRTRKATSADQNQQPVLGVVSPPEVNVQQPVTE